MIIEIIKIKFHEKIKVNHVADDALVSLTPKHHQLQGWFTNQSVIVVSRLGDVLVGPGVSGDCM